MKCNPDETTDESWWNYATEVSYEEVKFTNTKAALRFFVEIQFVESRLVERGLVEFQFVETLFLHFIRGKDILVEKKY